MKSLKYVLYDVYPCYNTFCLIYLTQIYCDEEGVSVYLTQNKQSKGAVGVNYIFSCLFC